NQNLSNFSDIAFQTAFVVYAVALVFSLVYYGRLNGVITARREHAGAHAKTREHSTANAKATASVAAQGGDSSDALAVDEAADETSTSVSASDIAAQES